mmetsp:Transcript_1338/g.1866  ORF Transcript_1338/g.1866 Transcript_1338/m.1866 type:complete len:479 (-) Transcript_1338:119-1555(-)
MTSEMAAEEETEPTSNSDVEMSLTPKEDNNQSSEFEDNDEEQHESTTTTRTRTTTPLPSHLMNKEAHPAYIRYGIPLFLLCTFSLLLASDLSSGVSAEARLTISGKVISHETLFTVSIFSSVSKLWEAKSYPLAILIFITSICWPYLKLALCIFSWATPAGSHRRESLIEWLDALGKWSFVDIFVLMVVMVAFRTSVPLGSKETQAVNDIYVVPKWGFFGFVFASICSLVVTHTILYRHRQVLYSKDYALDVRAVEGDEETSAKNEADVNFSAKAPLFQKTGRSPVLIALLLVTTFVLLLVGSLVTSFTFTYQRGESYYEERDFSIANIGLYVADTALDANTFGIRFLQIIYFILAIVTPLENIVVFLVLYFVPMNGRLQRHVFFLSEITFAWSTAEVMMISAIFSTKQIPNFGNAIVDTGCETCYVVGAILRHPFWVYFAGAVLNLVVTFWLFRGAHCCLYDCGKMRVDRSRKGLFC